MTTDEKYSLLRERIKACGSLAVAFSGGVDSCFLLKTAQDVLSGRVLALTVCSDFVPARERKEAAEFCRRYGIRQELLYVDVLADPEVKDNPPDRCYHCKRALFSLMKERAAALGFPLLAEGSNLDDLDDYRPGMRAVGELGVLSPLRDASLRKNEIRELSKRLGLASWDKPSFACLASRFVYGETITAEKLRRVEAAEDCLRSLGFRQYRVRSHGELARIELLPEELPRLADAPLREEVHDALKKLGFRYVSLDLAGFRSGSMNESLDK